MAQPRAPLIDPWDSDDEVEEATSKPRATKAEAKASKSRVTKKAKVKALELHDGKLPCSGVCGKRYTYHTLYRNGGLCGRCFERSVQASGGHYSGSLSKGTMMVPGAHRYYSAGFQRATREEVAEEIDAILAEEPETDDEV